MRMYYLCRKEDVSGTSGTGHIAELAEFDDGAVVVRWVAEMNAVGVASTTVFESINDLLKVHGHEGRTHVDLVLDSNRSAELESTVEALRKQLDAAIEMLEAHGLSLPGAVRVEQPAVPQCEAEPQ
jgi:hypothetical protein